MPLLVSSLMVVSWDAALSPSTSQARGATSTARPAIRACSLLTKELVTKVTPFDAKTLQVYFFGNAEPEADSLGAGGTDCSYGGIAIQIDPNFSYDAFKKQKGWETAEPVGGLGDEALFHDNIGEWAEMIVRSGPHLLTIRMDIPKGHSGASIKPNVVTLAKELLPRIK